MKNCRKKSVCVDQCWNVCVVIIIIVNQVHRLHQSESNARGNNWMAFSRQFEARPQVKVANARSSQLNQRFPKKWKSKWFVELFGTLTIMLREEVVGEQIRFSLCQKKKKRRKKKGSFPKPQRWLRLQKWQLFTHRSADRPSLSLSPQPACLLASVRACVRRVCFGRSWEVKSIDALGWLLLPLSVRAHCPHPPDTFVDFFFLLLQSLFGIFCLLKSSSACLFTQARSSPSTRQIEAFVSLCSVTASNVRACVCLQRARWPLKSSLVFLLNPLRLMNRAFGEICWWVSVRYETAVSFYVGL